MYPTTRESVMAVISNSVAENAVCWCEGRKKRSKRILRRLTHPAVAGRVIGGMESGKAIAGINRGVGGKGGEPLLVGPTSVYNS